MNIALLELEFPPKDIKGAKLGNSDLIKISDNICIVRISSDGQSQIVQGRVTKLHNSEAVLDFFESNFFETDLHLGQRDLGAAVFTENGELVGIIGKTSVIPSNLITELMLGDPLAWSGVSGKLISGKGLLVENIGDDSPFRKMGLHSGGDIILTVDKITLGDENGLQQARRYLKSLPKNANLKLKVFRDGQTQELQAVQQSN